MELKDKLLFTKTNLDFLEFPCFFPSISTVKTNLPILDYLTVLKAVQVKQFLISAYDIFNSEQKQEIYEKLDSFDSNKTSILLDSGNYESYWKNDIDWTSKKFNSILNDKKWSIAFCFDNQNILSNVDDVINDVTQSCKRDECSLKNGTLVPIVHASKELLPEVVFGISKKLNPEMIAIPERILGDGLIERSKTLFNIRRFLIENKTFVPIHLLGTGNPRSILLYSQCGANSFDGLEWCQTTVNHKTSLLYHFQQRELFDDDCLYCKMDDVPYSYVTLCHNLLYYEKWMDSLRQSLALGKINEYNECLLPKHFLNKLKSNLKEVFD